MSKPQVEHEAVEWMVRKMIVQGIVEPEARQLSATSQQVMMQIVAYRDGLTEGEQRIAALEADVKRITEEREWLAGATDDEALKAANKRIVELEAELQEYRDESDELTRDDIEQCKRIAALEEQLRSVLEALQQTGNIHCNWYAVFAARDKARALLEGK